MTSDGAERADEHADTGTRTIHLASWDDRFFAWLVDVVLVGAVLSALGQVAGVFSLLAGSLSLSAPFVGANGVGLWLYWTVLEGTRGQSAGKTVMDIAVTDEYGVDVGYAAAAVESFGTALLLPLDVLVGWLAMEDEYVRLFNGLSSTIVVDLPDAGAALEGVEYVPPES